MKVAKLQKMQSTHFNTATGKIFDMSSKLSQVIMYTASDFNPQRSA